MAAILSAIVYGASYPLYKLLLFDFPPLYLGGLIYLVSGAYLFLLRMLPKGAMVHLYRFLGLNYRELFTISSSDLMAIFIIAFTGAFLAPYIFLMGLQIIPAVDASLLSISELVFTLLIAKIFLGEIFRRFELVGILLIGLGIVITLNPGFQLLFTGDIYGYLLILIGCLLWAIDNNISKVLSLRGDVIEVASMKSLIGGGLLIFFSLLLGKSMPLDYIHIILIVFIGIFCLGNALLLFFTGLYHIGSGKTTAIYSTYTLFGVLWASIIIREKIYFSHLTALILITLGIILMYFIYEKPIK